MSEIAQRAAAAESGGAAIPEGFSWGWIAFLAIWVLQLLLIRRGMETIRRFQDFAAPAGSR